MIRELPAHLPDDALAVVHRVASEGIGIFVDGAEHSTSATFTHEDPFSGEPWYQAANATASNVDEAVASAVSAGKAWAARPAYKRAEILLRVADAIERNAAPIGLLDTLDNGKLFRETRSQAVGIARSLRYSAGGAERLEGVTAPSGRDKTLAMSIRVPYGVIGVIVPWNSPAPLLFSTAAPAIAAGNTVVVKTSEDAPASIVEIARIAVAAGLPAGVLNVVSGAGGAAGSALVDHPDVAKIVFTGGELVGRKVAAAAGARLIPSVLELGGKSAQIIMADADMDRVIPGLVSGVFAAGGQTCVAGGRALVQRPVYDRIVEELAAAAADIVLGDPIDTTTQMGPLGSRRHLQNVLRHVGRAQESGARLVAGGKTRPTGSGNGEYFTPAVLADVTSTNPLFNEEVFGPVVGITPFDSYEEAIALVNDSKYGLASGIWTRDLDTALRAAHEIEAGTVWVNTYRAPETTLPSGGFKDSGYGRLGGSRDLHEFTQEKSIIMNYSGISNDPFIMGGGYESAGIESNGSSIKCLNIQ